MTLADKGFHFWRDRYAVGQYQQAVFAPIRRQCNNIKLAMQIAEYAQSPLVKAAREMKPEKPAIPLASTLAATETPPEFSPEAPTSLLSTPRKVPTLQKTPLPQQKNKVNWVLYAIATVLTALLFLLVFPSA